MIQQFSVEYLKQWRAFINKVQDECRHQLNRAESLGYSVNGPCMRFWREFFDEAVKIREEMNYEEK